VQQNNAVFSGNLMPKVYCTKHLVAHLALKPFLMILTPVFRFLVSLKIRIQAYPVF